jgi:hypothetical protein
MEELISPSAALLLCFFGGDVSDLFKEGCGSLTDNYAFKYALLVFIVFAFFKFGDDLPTRAAFALTFGFIVFALNSFQRGRRESCWHKGREEEEEERAEKH